MLREIMTHGVLHTKAKGKRQKAKGKRQKAKVADVSRRLPFRWQCPKTMWLGNVFLPFAFCLLPCHRRWPSLPTVDRRNSRKIFHSIFFVTGS
jgi:hypothetical protein